MEPDWQAEIADLHRFFTAWLAGTISNDDATFARLPSALDEGFTFAGTDGSLMERPALLSWLRGAHGGRTDLRIRIENPRLLFDDGSTVVAHYEEWQEEGNQTTARRSTVVFRRAAKGLSWLHVHETWMQ